jgi:hypothetical protein
MPSIFVIILFVPVANVRAAVPFSIRMLVVLRAGVHRGVGTVPRVLRRVATATVYAGSLVFTVISKELLAWQKIC